MSPELFAQENVADQTDHFPNAFVRENVVYGYDILTTFTSLPKGTILFREIQSKNWAF